MVCAYAMPKVPNLKRASIMYLQHRKHACTKIWEQCLLHVIILLLHKKLNKVNNNNSWCRLIYKIKWISWYQLDMQDIKCIINMNLKCSYYNFKSQYSNIITNKDLKINRIFKIVSSLEKISSTQVLLAPNAYKIFFKVF